VVSEVSAVIIKNSIIHITHRAKRTHITHSEMLTHNHVRLTIYLHIVEIFVLI
jgi:hypothetical protein